MEQELLYLINQARTSPEEMKTNFQEMQISEGKATFAETTWGTSVTPEEISSILESLESELPELLIEPEPVGEVRIDLEIAEGIPPLGVLLELLNLHKDTLLSASFNRASLSISESSLNLCLFSVVPEIEPQTISKKSVSKPASLQSSSVSMRVRITPEDQLKTFAQEIVSNPRQREKYRQYILLGNKWILELSKKFGPLSGYELNEFLRWFRYFSERVPKSKAISIPHEKKAPIIDKSNVYEAGIMPTGQVTVKVEPKAEFMGSAIDLAANEFVESGESVKFTFKAQKRFEDLKDIISTSKGNVNPSQIMAKAGTSINGKKPALESSNFHTLDYSNIEFVMPEVVSDAANRDKQLQIPEKYAGLLKDLKWEKPPSPEPPKERPEFVNKFKTVDSNTRKAIVAAENAKKEEFSEKLDVSKHRFREEFIPEEHGKPDFVLKFIPPKPEPLKTTYEPYGERETLDREAKRQKEEGDRMARTYVAGKNRPEFSAKFNPAPRSLQMGTSRPHDLLDN